MKRTRDVTRYTNTKIILGGNYVINVKRERERERERERGYTIKNMKVSKRSSSDHKKVK